MDKRLQQSGKFIYKGVKAYKQGKNIVKAIDTVRDIYGIVKKIGNKGIQKIASTTGSLIENASRAFGKNPALAVEGAGAIRGNIPELGKIGIFKAEETAVQKSFKEIYKDSGAGTGKIEDVAAEAIENATNAMSHMAINSLHSFMDDLGIFLKREAMDMPEFTISRMTPPEMLSTDDILKLKRIRDAITVTDDTLCAKILPKSVANKYECNLIDSTFDCRTVRGYITRAEDTKGLNTYQNYYDTARLDYNGTEFHPVRDDYISIMYFKTENTNAIKIPYGGVSDADLIAFSDATGLPRSELVKQQWPFTGNGFTASESSKTLPEFTTKAGMGLDINKGKEYIYSPNKNKEVLLLSNDPSDLNHGFRASVSGNGYVKSVPKTELDELFMISIFGIYKEHKVIVIADEGENYLIEGFEYGQNESIMTNLGFNAVERGIYQKKISKNELTKIWEEKTNI